MAVHHRSLVDLHAPVKIIVLTAKESNHMQSLHASGRSGFVKKNQDLCELARIHAVNDGLGYFAQRALPWSISSSQQEQEAMFKKLSLRELDLLQQLSQGFPTNRLPNACR